MRPATRRALALVAVGVLLAVVCGLLGRWQWNRHVWRDAQIAQVEAAWSATPEPLADVVADPSAALPAQDEWRRVSVEGRYVPEATVLLRNRPVDGQVAFHVLVPFVTARGEVLVVDRGWVPAGADASASVTPPAPPAGEVTLTVRLRPDEPASSRTAPAGQVQAIHVAQVLAAAGPARPGGTAAGFYGAAAAESPAPATALGALPEPSTDPGSHLSYAFQWWVFAVGGLVAFTWMARREVREADAPDVVGHRAAGAGPGAAPGAGPGPHDPTPAPEQAGAAGDAGRSAPAVRPVGARPSGPRRRGRAEVDEDALVDAQLRAASPPVTPGR